MCRRLGSKWGSYRAILCFGIFLDRDVLCYVPWNWQLSLAFDGFGLIIKSKFMVVSNEDWIGPMILSEEIAILTTVPLLHVA